VLIRRIGRQLASARQPRAHGRERFRVKGKIRALSAEGRLSAIVLITIPILVLAFLWFWHPAYLRPLWEWRYGPLLIAGTIAWMAIGVLWIRSIVNIRF
jgi:tight adherence protein B